jgi:HEAT repeat protein
MRNPILFALLTMAVGWTGGMASDPGNGPTLPMPRTATGGDGRSSGPDLINELLVIAKSPEQSTDARTTAIVTLGDLGPQAIVAVTGLTELLADPKGKDVHLEVVRTLGRIGPASTKAVPGIIKAMGTDPELKMVAQAAIQQILNTAPTASKPTTPPAPAAAKTSKTLKDLLTDLGSQDEKVRVLAVMGLPKFATDPSVLVNLQRVFKTDSSLYVRQVAAVSMANVSQTLSGGQQSFDLLFPLLTDATQDVGVRLLAAHIIENLVMLKSLTTDQTTKLKTALVDILKEANLDPGLSAMVTLLQSKVGKP